jgi:Fe-S-cluster-containing hydrogenase component 2
VTKLDPDTPIRFSVKSEVDEQGIPHVQMTMVEDIGKAMIGEASVERLWQFDDLSLTDNPKQQVILTLCTERLNKLEAIVAVCERKFLKYSIH